MSFADTYLVTDKLQAFSDAEVDAAEAELGTMFPTGYRDYMTTLGKGEYCDVISVHPPQIILNTHFGEKPPLAEFCNSWEDMWGEGETDISPERLAKSVLLAVSTWGDWVMFEPHSPSTVYVLPESEDVVYKAGPTLLDALTWLCEPKRPKHRPRFRYFNSGIDQKREGPPSAVRLTLEELRDWLLALNEHDHLEETWNDNPGVSIEEYVRLKGRLDSVNPELQEVKAFYKSFGGYVTASVDAVGSVSAYVTHDVDSKMDLVQNILDYLWSKAA